jgi:hypothetical protein
MICSLLGLTSCSQNKIADVAKNSPGFIPEEVLIGKMTGEGAVFDRFGNFQRGFRIYLDGSKQESGGVILKELLVYETGEEESRTYTFSKKSDTSYEATSETGLVGVADIESVGNVLHWKYVFEVPYRGKIRHMRFDDWMYLQENGSIINRATIYWWGIRVGELFMLIRRDSL